MTHRLSSHLWLVFLFLVFFPLIVTAQNKAVSSLSRADYSQLLLNRYKSITSKTTDEVGQRPNRAKHNMTMLLVEVKKNWSKLTPEAQQIFKAQDTRPTGLNLTYEETTKNFFRFYYTKTGTDAVATADANSNGVPDYVENMATAFCKALAFYDSVGYNRPPIATSDNGRFCVYLSSSTAGDYVYGYSSPETNIGDNPLTTTQTEVNAYTSYMVMRNEYADFGTTAAEFQIAMEVTAAHEFFHSVQFGYEYDNMEGYLMEMCSTWAEDKVFPGDDDNWQYLTDIFGTPDVSIDWDEYLDGDAVTYSSDYAYHWYAAWIFMRYLTDQYDNTIPKQIFEGNIKTNTSGAIDNVLKTKGSSYVNAIKDYNIAIGLLTQSTTAPLSTYHFQRANDYRTLTKNSGGSPAGPFVVKYENTLNYSGTAVTYSSSTKGDKRLMRASADFLKITPNANFSVTITPKVASTYFAARLIKADSYTNPTNLSVVEATVTGNNYVFNVTDKASYANYVLVLYNTRYSTAASRDTTSIQYDIVVDKAILTDGVRLTSPVGAESWQIGTVHNITWESANVTNVMLEYSTDNAATWTTIAASTPAAAGSYAWTVPATASANCKVRISDAANAASNSVSTNVFSIIQPLPFGIISPNGGESWQIGSKHAITWNPNSVTNVMIELTTDGTSWSTIVASTPASTGSYSWTIPSSLSTTCKVRISDAANVSVTSTSANAFSIIPAVVQTTVLTEDFVKATAGSLASPDGTDISTKLDTYTSTAGWTGAKVYQAAGTFKMGSSSAIGYLVTPSLDLSTNGGSGTLTFDLQAFGTDTTSIQVFLSTDGGTNYTQLGSNIGVTTGMVTKVIPYFGGTATSKIKFTGRTASKNRFFLDNVSVVSGGITAIGETSTSRTIPNGFVLAQNYPNPFNPSTTIAFALPVRTNVQLNIFNQLGERVASLVNGELEAGSHSIVWNASNQVSGIYFYQLKTGNYAVVKKLVLMK